MAVHPLSDLHESGHRRPVEFYEYFMLVVFQNDCIHHYDSGVHDSITDMLCAFVSGLYVTGQFHRWMKSGKEGFFVRLCNRFCQANGIGENGKEEEGSNV